MIGSGPADSGSIPPPGVGRRSRLLPPPEDRRGFAIAIVSTIVVFGLLAWVIVNSSGWPRVQQSFFDPETFAESWPRVTRAFWVNVQLFLLAEVLVLVLGLVIAVLRSLPGAALAPVRLLATGYVDLFRALPGILVISMLGFGVPALRIEGLPNDEFFWALVALTLLYSAYVSEVYRAGIESVHPSQGAAARSLGLSQLQAMRFVIVPQAIRRVIPPLLNDFIGLQKDTALVSVLGVVEVFRAAQIRQAATFNSTPYVITALIFLLLTIPMARLVDWLASRDRGSGRARTVATGATAAGGRS
ncbi:MAG TPA: amino acid ABC transporter permease [Candidatus Limnocylindrales bacterium]|nr:amino acid ABC transporter permease [Candidatus Limnocylindrales bacterium]